ncbi:uncharacterized protein LOC143296989 isoform X2 [Babylonia areolata]|uniref:uncharacterized protein LOC143296989 isoform X2 n=1 Tax=Babylonia areolata TaxID=304850 RepID=UPI003FD5997E
MSMKMEKLEAQYVVSTEGSGWLQESGKRSIQRYFGHYASDVSVADAGQGRLVVSLRKAVKSLKVSSLVSILRDLLKPYHEQHHTVDGHRLRVGLVVPDVYGCEVKVTKGRVEVRVGQDAINGITHDDQWEDNLTQMITDVLGDTLSVKYSPQGQVTIMLVASEYRYGCLQWELYVVNSLIQLLHPFQAVLPTMPRCVADRSIADTLSSSAWNTDSNQEDVFLHFGTSINHAFVQNKVFLRRMNKAYPGLQPCFLPGSKALKISGGADAVKKVAQFISGFNRNLVLKHVRVTELQATLMETAAAHRLLQKSLDSQQVVCVWDRGSFTAQPTPLASLFSRSKSRTPKCKVIAVTAPRSDVQTALQVFQSCFQTTEVTLDKKQFPLLQSNTLKEFLDDLQRSEKDGVAPVFQVGQDKIIICDAVSNINSTHKAVLEFFYNNLAESHQEFCKQKVTKMITTLQPWQTKFLWEVQVSEQLPTCLQQTLSVNPEITAACIFAPVHLVDKCVADFWTFVMELSHQVIPLTAASIQVLQIPGSRKRVQALMDKEGVVCDWHVEQGRLVISAQRSHMPRLEHIFRAEIETTHPVFESQLGQQVNEPQAEEIKANAEDRGQTDYSLIKECKEQQTETIDTEDKLPELRAGAEEVQTEENNVGTEGNWTQSRTRNEENQEERATETEGQTVEVQTQTPMRHLEHLEQQTDTRSVNNDVTDRSSKQEMDVEKNHACPPPKELHTEEGQAENPEIQTTQKHQEAEVEWSDSDNGQSHDGTEQVRPQLFPLHTVHQVSHDLSGHSLDLQDDHQPSVQITEGFGDQSEQGDTSAEGTSFTPQESVISSGVDSTEDHVKDNATSTSDLCPPQHLCALTQGQQFLPFRHGGGRKRQPQRGAGLVETAEEELSSTSSQQEYERCHRALQRRRSRQQRNRNRAAGSQSGYTREPRGRTRETQGDSRHDRMVLNLQQEVEQLKADVRTLMEHLQQQNDDSSDTGSIQDTSEPESLSEKASDHQQRQQQLLQQQNYDSSDILMIQNASDPGSLSDSASECQQQQQQRQQQQRRQQQQLLLQQQNGDAFDMLLIQNESNSGSHTDSASE